MPKFRLFKPKQSTKKEIPTVGEMTLWQHIGELRSRLFKCLLAMIATIIIASIFAQQIISYLAVPIGGLEKLTSIEVTENMSVFMRVSLLGGFILALPVIVYQIAAFVMPGLKKSERKYVIMAIPAASILFLCGVAFAFYIMMPAAIPFLTEFLGINTIPRLSNYMSFVTNLMFWIGVCFETPLVIFILAKLGIVSAGALARQWRIAIVIIAIVAAVVTPTADPINMGLLMLPLMVLYLLSIALAKIARREPKVRTKAAV
ncbi:MAG: twin-arginine translocase subunit TatC [Anaerolineaceae bacterium]